jgi:hypothetical protein
MDDLPIEAVVNTPFTIKADGAKRGKTAWRSPPRTTLEAGSSEPSGMRPG